MYESACKLMAKQKVALECLSYHATASRDQTIKLVQDTIQPAEIFKLYCYNFSGKNDKSICYFQYFFLYLFFFFQSLDFDLTDDDTCRATVRMFLQCNLVQQFHIPYDVSIFHLK